MLRRSFFVLVLHSVLCLFVSRAYADDGWTGKQIIVKNPNVTVHFTSADGTPMQAPIRGIIQQVRSVKGDWLEVGNNGDPAWLSKDDVVLLDKANDYFTRQIESDPTDAFAFGYRGAAHAAKGDLQHALEDMTSAIDLNPLDATWFSNRGVIWNELLEFDRALEDQNEAIRLNPTYATAFNNRGLVWINKEKFDNALSDFNEAIRFELNYEQAFLNRGNAWSKKKDYERALADYKQAVRLDPKDANAYNQLAWLLATCPKEALRNSKQAITYAKTACELSNWKIGEFIDTLATAYAANGEFEQAVKMEQKALDDADYVTRNGQEASERFKLFEQKQAYRQKE
jgi:tetratricopeptide (TPR) repeat protein